MELYLYMLATLAAVAATLSIAYLLYRDNLHRATIHGCREEIQVNKILIQRLEKRMSNAEETLTLLTRNSLAAERSAIATNLAFSTRLDTLERTK